MRNMVMKQLWIGLIVGAACLSAFRAPVVILNSKPTENVVVQSDPDGTDLLAFDAEEDVAAVRYAWGQSFMVPRSMGMEKVFR